MVKNPKILISGAGIAGPTLAYWLQRSGFEPTLIERAPALREGGYIIDFWGRGVDVAEKMDLLPALRQNGYEIEDVRLVDRRGRRVGGFSWRAFRSTLGDRYLSILRGDLSRFIYEALGGRVRTIFGDRITAIRQEDDGVSVAFAHAAAERFDLVIGAGGLHSPVRALVFGPDDRYQTYLGYDTASFSIEGYPRRDPRSYVSFAAPARQVTRYSLRDDRTVFFFVFSRRAEFPDAQNDPALQKKILRDVFGRDAWECPDILGALDAASDLYFDSVSQIRMETWSSGRVALVGDACFCPSLLAGQGSALAMTGAYILAGELMMAGGDHRTAFRRYQDLFLPFIRRKQRAAERFARSFVPRTKLGIFVRNQLTRLMAIPPVARLTIGPLLSDPLILPAYDWR